MTRREKQRAHRLLYQAYCEAVDRLTDELLAQDDDFAGGSFDYGWEELQDRYAMRVQHLQVLLNALEGASQRPHRSKRWVVSFTVQADELERELNARLEEPVADNGEVEDFDILPADDGRLRVVIRYRAFIPVPARMAPARG